MTSRIEGRYVPLSRAVLLVAAVLAAACGSKGKGPDLSACDAASFQTILTAVPPPVGGGPGETTLRIHYHRPDADYAGWVLHAWEAAIDPGWSTGYPPSGSDTFGVFWDVPLAASSGRVGYIFHKGETKDLPDDQFYPLHSGANEIWRIAADPTTYYSNPLTAGPLDLTTVRVHYWRFDGAYGDWGLHLWDGSGIDVTPLAGLTLNDWANPVPLASMPGYSSAADGSEVAFDIPVLNPAGDSLRTTLSFVLHGLPSNPVGGVDNKDGRTADIVVAYAALTIVSRTAEVWLVQGDATVYTAPPDLSSVSTVDARAYWLDRHLLQWPKVNGAGTFRLYHSRDGQIVAAKSAAVTGADGSLALDVYAGPVPPTLATRFKFVAGGVVLQVPAADADRLPGLLASQLVLVQEDVGGLVRNATTAQVAGVLDDLYGTANDAATDFGVTPTGGATRFKLWAPTAQRVSVCTFASGSGGASAVDAMTFDATSGAWSATRSGDLSGGYYTYVVDAFVRGTGVVRNRVTDPYSVSLTTDSRRSYVADLSSAALAPPSWSTDTAPATVPAQTDMVIYELHVRDFSANDPTVTAPNRGKYLAFTEAGSNGMKHLAALAAAGLTDVHLLPIFDFATVKEDRAVRVELDDLFSTLCDRNANVARSRCDQFAGMTVAEATGTYAASSEQQQIIAGYLKDLDGFNWGYDPWHYTAPEGSYATDAADGAKRIVEARRMIQALHSVGLRVGMDVVYNHTTAAGQAERSVLDRVVPGYYHRLSAAGDVETSTCCSNTATENVMMAKLMTDSAVTWATQYHVDSFRFDLMGHQPRAVMEALKAKVDAAAGRPIRLIGEGWNFGEVANGARFVQASQLSLGGSGIATFSDRARDRIRGGGPFDSGDSLVKNQGYVNGLYYDDNGSGAGKTATELLQAADMVRLGLAGSIKDYVLTTYDDLATPLWNVDYNGAPAGYVTEPAEVVNYVENHDNQTLFDIGVYKLPLATVEDDRVRSQMLGVALNAFSQGIAYFHAGVDTLRSKSMDRNSYDSGDWFNRLDWSYADDFFGVGAPPAGDNQPSYAVLKPRLAMAGIKPSPAGIARARDLFRDLLAIRKSSTLFRLRTAADVKARLTFYNTGSTQVPTVIAGHLDGAGYAGAGFQEILYLVNVDKAPHAITVDAETSKLWVLHPVHLAASAADPRPAADAIYESATGTFTVPPRTAVVYVIP